MWRKKTSGQSIEMLAAGPTTKGSPFLAALVEPRVLSDAEAKGMRV